MTIRNKSIKCHQWEEWGGGMSTGGGKTHTFKKGRISKKILLLPPATNK